MVGRARPGYLSRGPSSYSYATVVCIYLPVRACMPGRGTLRPAYSQLLVLFPWSRYELRPWQSHSTQTAWVKIMNHRMRRSIENIRYLVRVSVRTECHCPARTYISHKKINLPLPMVRSSDRAISRPKYYKRGQTPMLIAPCSNNNIALRLCASDD